ncbi:MAG: uncharacterized SAM-binding protein YcdF (DUF218 family) [Chlamydiales bacterium]|jgi:uncharacterized SAM-binding protein YcdF (DUF218 family)
MLYVLKLLVSVPACLFLLVGAGWLVARRRRPLGRWMMIVGTSFLVLLCIPWCAAGLLRSLQSTPPLADPSALAPQAIVILSADAVSWAPEYGTATVGRLTLERLRYGAHLARQTDLPLLVTGGASRPDVAPRAVLMQRVLEQEFGLPVRHVEGRSSDTLGNARESARLLRSDGIERVLLVTHAWHMPRALAAFRSTGLEVVPAPTAFRDWPQPGLAAFVPSARSLQESSWALHEWLGRAYYALRIRRRPGA